MNLTRFVSRSSVFVSLALESTPDRVPELDETEKKGKQTGETKRRKQKGETKRGFE